MAPSKSHPGFLLLPHPFHLTHQIHPQNRPGFSPLPSPPLPLSPLPGLWLGASKPLLIHLVAASEGLDNLSSTVTGPAFNLTFTFNPLPRPNSGRTPESCTDHRQDKLTITPGLHHLLSSHPSGADRTPSSLNAPAEPCLTSSWACQVTPGIPESSFPSSLPLSPSLMTSQPAGIHLASKVR